MVKHIQTIRILSANFLNVFDHFVGLALKGLRLLPRQLYIFEQLRDLMNRCFKIAFLHLLVLLLTLQLGVLKVLKKPYFD